ncbi:glycosyltransferase family 18 protein [Mixia osmundae IAM 14324]|uniref:alpha-1,6-mannosyl-glycoprotein 6-beta-N-acetylglucosaminyltransferase n=1 Tax=Mixia osmundae (strain CBS 9802 / IAM 14324 / JCM 22182 / KY 12970) TaxID=764103 RepID=G7DWC4_MIXOS|nr:glycosyltransferase family 18 protein [Mixia osmundae IAM 14324]KEI40933.1 glycosyltransferase family 18 protein [Mixia osmundae IAM 14324]GAA94884.1 hypothetical protein E5Q_01539 [Mixia osmundae IAM 14324]
MSEPLDEPDVSIADVRHPLLQAGSERRLSNASEDSIDDLPDSADEKPAEAAPASTLQARPSPKTKRRRVWALIGVGLLFVLGGSIVALSSSHDPNTYGHSVLDSVVGGLRNLTSSTTCVSSIDTLAAERMANATALIAMPPWGHPKLAFHRDTLATLILCKTLGTCTDKQKQVVLVVAHRFHWVWDDTFNRPSEFANGEAILAKSMVEGLAKLGYPLVFLDEVDLYRAGRVHALLTDHVKMVVFDYISMPLCREHERCGKTASFPEGIPAWKQFQWDGLVGIEPGRLWRQPWHLSGIPHPEINATYLGFSAELDCRPIPYIPAQERPRTAWILGKERQFYQPDKSAWTEEDFAAVVDHSSLELLAGIQYEPAELPIPSTFSNMGTLSRLDFMQQLSKTRVIIGTNNPPESPSPIEGLCLGTPFIMPVSADLHVPQHRLLAQFKPPAVYTVNAGDRQALLDAVQQAIAHPLDGPFIPESLSWSAYLDRLQSIMSRDWQQVHQDLAPPEDLALDGYLPGWDNN